MKMKAEIRGGMFPEAKVTSDLGNQGLPATCRSWREAWIRHDLMASEGTSPAHTLILDFRPPEL